MSTQSEVPIWGDFQAILHLSIALNAVYAAAYEFIKETIRQEADAVREYLANLSQMNERTDEIIKAKSAFRDFLCILNGVEMESTRFNNKALKPAAAVCMFVGVGELIYSCYYFHEPISHLMSVITCCLLFQLLSPLWYILFLPLI
jgi:hypothetical protein